MTLHPAAACTIGRYARSCMHSQLGSQQEIPVGAYAVLVLWEPPQSEMNT